MIEVQDADLTAASSSLQYAALHFHLICVLADSRAAALPMFPEKMFPEKLF